MNRIAVAAFDDLAVRQHAHPGQRIPLVGCEPDRHGGKVAGSVLARLRVPCLPTRSPIGVAALRPHVPDRTEHDGT